VALAAARVGKVRQIVSAARQYRVRETTEETARGSTTLAVAAAPVRLGVMRPATQQAAAAREYQTTSPDQQSLVLAAAAVVLSVAQPGKAEPAAAVMEQTTTTLMLETAHRIPAPVVAVPALAAVPAAPAALAVPASSSFE